MVVIDPAESKHLDLLNVGLLDLCELLVCVSIVNFPRDNCPAGCTPSQGTRLAKVDWDVFVLQPSESGTWERSKWCPSLLLGNEESEDPFTGRDWSVVFSAVGGAHSAKKMPTELVKTLSQNASIVGRYIGEHQVFTPTILVIL